MRVVTLFMTVTSEFSRRLRADHVYLRGHNSGSCAVQHKSWSTLWLAFLAVGLGTGCQSGPEPRSSEKASAKMTITPVLAVLRSVPVRTAITSNFESRRRTLDLILGSLNKEAEAMDSPPAAAPTPDRGTAQMSKHKPGGGKSPLNHAAVSPSTTPGLKRAIDSRHEVPEASLISTRSAPPVAPKPLRSRKATARGVTLPAADGLVVGLIVLWFLALVMRPFDKPTVLAVLYCGLVFAGGRYSEFSFVETYLTTVISFVLGLGFFWILHKARRSNPRWLFIFLLGPVAIEAVWVLPGILAG